MKATTEGELWVWQDCIVSGPGGEKFVQRCGAQKFPLWADKEITAGDYQVGMEKRLREECGLAVRSWIGHPEFAEAA